MILRKQYLEKLKKMQNKQIIKIVTGVRRCGKSTLLKQFQDYLLECGVETAQIIAINFEDMANEPLLDYHALHAYVSERLLDGKITYVFLDEIQVVPQFQKAVNSLFIKENVDLYITGSNAWLLSGELATLLSGRYIELKLLPFSFAEYFQLVGGDKRDAWKAYFQNGGFPYTAFIEDAEIRQDYLNGIYSTVLLKDIVARKRIMDVSLLESVIKYLFANIGSIISAKKIADSLTSLGRRTTAVTVENYLEALLEAFILYKAGRYDVKGKQHLKSLEKYYLVDVGLRRFLLGAKNSDIGHLLENIVYLELLRRGYTVSVGKIGDMEIDFIAETGDERIYYQVAASIMEPQTYARELRPLLKVKDHYPKFIISLDELALVEAGIRQVNMLDFLLEKA